MPQVQRSGADLEHQWRHEEVVVPTDQHDLRLVPGNEPFQVAGRMDAGKSAAENDDAA